jgi:acetyl/propionyl-CoA carboxylase alpha subunit
MDRMARALDEFIIRGVHTTIPLHQLILKDPNFRRGRYSTSFIDRLLASTVLSGLVGARPGESAPVAAGSAEG